MVLASDAKDLSGRVLLTAGNELTEKHLRVFKIWGISEADVQGIDQKDVVEQEVAQVDPEVREKAEEKVRGLFALTERTHPAILELSRLALLRLVKGNGGSQQ